MKKRKTNRMSKYNSLKGQLSWGHKLAIYDAYGNEVGMVVQKVLTFLPKFQFVLLNKIKFCQIIMPVYVKYALAFLWTILQECPCVDKN